MAHRKNEAARAANWAARVEAGIAARLDRGKPRYTDIEIPDHCSHEGACRLARRLEAHWNGRVTCVVVPDGKFGWAVRSDLGPGGLPER